MNEENATATQREDREGGDAANQQPSAVAASGGKQRKGKDKKPPTLPKLEGKYLFIKPIVESQRVSLGKSMVEISKAMLTLVYQINHRNETIANFEGKYFDKLDPDDNGNGKEKTFVPISLRKKNPLNFSKKVKNDSRCSIPFGAITTTMEKANAFHEAYKIQMAKYAKDIAEQELIARHLLLFCTYSDAVMKIAEGLVKVGKRKIKYSPTMSENEVVQGAVHDFFKDVPATHWDALPFMEDSKDEAKLKFYKEFEAHVGSKYMEKVKPILDNNELWEGGERHPDTPLINWVQNQLLEIIPTLTTKFWEHEEQQDEDMKLDAELEELFEKKDIDDANQDLAAGMEVEPEETVGPLIQREVKAGFDKRVSANKRKARKNSSGDNKNQESTPTDNGQKSQEKSNHRQGKQRGKSRKRYNNYSDDDSYDSRYNERRSSHRSRYRDYDDDRYYHNDRRSHSNNDRHHRDERRPRSILRNQRRGRERSVSWGRSPTPPPSRHRYSQWDPPRRSEGAHYHESRGGGRHSQRKGGRGGSSKGGRGNGGRRN